MERSVYIGRNLHEYRVVALMASKPYPIMGPVIKVDFKTFSRDTKITFFLKTSNFVSLSQKSYHSVSVVCYSFFYD